jgi:PST family polysaccharide transporter
MAQLFGQAASFALRFAYLAIMARLLDPIDFGLFAMITAVTGLYGILMAGLSAPTIQAPTITQEKLSALFWVNILVGASVTVLCVLTAPVLVSFYNEPRLFWMTVTAAMAFMINALVIQHTTLLQRQMRYVVLMAIDTLSLFATCAVGVGLAIAGFGYWALVAGTVVSPLLTLISVWSVTRWVPGLPRRGTEIGSMLRFGGALTLNTLVLYVAYNTEKILVGRFWGADVLGLYGRAYHIVTIPTDNLNSAIGGVVFSALSRLQDDPVRFKSYFLKGYALLNSLTFPTSIFFALFANDVILVCLGPKWTEATPIFRLLTPTVVIFGVINPLSWLLLATGLYGRGLKIALVLAPFVVTACVLGLPFGATGVAIAFSAAMTLWLIPHVLWCLRGTIISPRDLLLAIYKPLISAVVAGIIAFGVQRYAAEVASPLLRLLLGGGVMATVYCLMLLFIMGQNALCLDIVRELRSSQLGSVRGN